MARVVKMISNLLCVYVFEWNWISSWFKQHRKIEWAWASNVIIWKIIRISVVWKKTNSCEVNISILILIWFSSVLILIRIHISLKDPLSQWEEKKSVSHFVHSYILIFLFRSFVWLWLLFLNSEFNSVLSVRVRDIFKSMLRSARNLVKSGVYTNGVLQSSMVKNRIGKIKIAIDLYICLRIFTHQRLKRNAQTKSPKKKQKQNGWAKRQRVSEWVNRIFLYRRR